MSSCEKGDIAFVKHSTVEENRGRESIIIPRCPHVLRGNIAFVKHSTVEENRGKESIIIPRCPHVRGGHCLCEAKHGGGEQS